MSKGLEVAPLLLVPALPLAGCAVYAYDRAREHQRKRIGRLLVAAALLVGIAVIGNASRIGGLVLARWGRPSAASAASACSKRECGCRAPNRSRAKHARTGTQRAMPLRLRPAVQTLLPAAAGTDQKVARA
jgi:hypothetical protein